MKRRAFQIFILVAAVVLLVGALAGCNDGNITYNKPVDWTTYLNDVTGMVADEIIAAGGTLGIEISGEAEIGGEVFNIYAGFNFDVLNLDKSKLAVKVVKGDDNKKEDLSDNNGQSSAEIASGNETENKYEYAAGDVVFAVMSDSNDTYVEIAPNAFIPDNKLKITNIGVLDWLQTGFAPDGDGTLRDRLQGMLFDLGETVFSGADVSPADSEYKFFFATENWTQRMKNYLSAIELAIGADTFKMMYGMFGAATAAEFAELMAAPSGYVSFKTENGSLNSVSTDNMTVSSKDVDMSLSFDVKSELTAALDEMFPESDDGYSVTKAACSSISGQLSLYDSTARRTAVNYDFELNVNLDIVKLALSGWDLSKLDDDNYFHFRLHHRCVQGACTEFCTSRISSARGAVADIAFSPSDFDSYNIFVNFDIKAMMSQEFLEEAVRRDDSAGEYLLPDYLFLTLPYSEFDSENPLRELMSSVYADLIYAEPADKISYSASIFDALRESYPLIDDIFGDYLVSGDYTADTLRLNVEENFYGQLAVYDIHKYTVYIIADDLAELKSYYWINNESLASYIALDWQFDEISVAADNGLNLTNVYDSNGNLLHGVAAADGKAQYVPMSPEEASALIGGHLKITYSNIYKSQHISSEATILAYEGLDTTDFENVQTVTLTVEYPNALDYSRFISHFGNDYSSSFTMKKDVRIKLSPLENFEFKANASEDDEFRITGSQTEPPKFLQGAANLTYKDGVEKTLHVLGTCAAVRTAKSALSSTILYYTERYGTHTVTFNVAGRRVETSVTIKQPDDYEYIGIGDEYATVNKSMFAYSMAYLYVWYNDDLTDEDKPRRISVRLNASDYYINGKSLGADSGEWLVSSSGRVTFLRAAKYKVEIRRDGFPTKAEQVINLFVAAKQSQPPSYTLNPSVYNRYYFTSADGSGSYEFRASLMNARHGEEETHDKNFTVSVYKADVSGSTLSYKKMNLTEQDGIYKDDAGLLNSVALKVGSGDYGGINAVYEVPSMINGYISVTAKLSFKQSGYYRVVMEMTGGASGSCRCQWDIYVGQYSAVNQST